MWPGDEEEGRMSPIVTITGIERYIPLNPAASLASGLNDLERAH